MRCQCGGQAGRRAQNARDELQRGRRRKEAKSRRGRRGRGERRRETGGRWRQNRQEAR